MSIINEIKPSIILINSYFGKEQLTDIKQKLKLTNIYIIEDITHTMLNNNLDIASSDFIIGSIRKWCAIPDGGFLINNTNLNINFNITKVNTEYVDLQLKAALLKDKYIKNVESSIKEKYMFLFKKSKEMLDNDGFIYSMSNESKTLMNNYDFETIKKIRKQNYNFLYENLVSCKFIKLPLGKLDTNEVPLYFPIFISKKRNEFQKYMSNLNIFLPIIWPKCELLPSNEYIANKIYDEIICIPCDQRYNLNDMKRIVTAIKEFERSEKNESIT